MLYVQLDTNWPDHHKIIDAGVDGAGAHAIILCLAKRLEQDGWVRRALLRRYGVDADLLGRLVELRLLEADEVQVRPHGWLDRNPSQAAIDASRAAKKEAGKRGNHEKWNHPGSFENCPKCNPEPQVVAGCDPTVSQGESPPIAGDRTPTKSESKSEVTIGIAGAILDHPPMPKLPVEVVEDGKAQVAALRSQLYPKGATGADAVVVQFGGPRSNGEAS